MKRSMIISIEVTNEEISMYKENIKNYKNGEYITQTPIEEVIYKINQDIKALNNLEVAKRRDALQTRGIVDEEVMFLIDDKLSELQQELKNIKIKLDNR